MSRTKKTALALAVLAGALITGCRDHLIIGPESAFAVDKDPKCRLVGNIAIECEATPSCYWDPDRGRFGQLVCTVVIKTGL